MGKSRSKREALKWRVIIIFFCVSIYLYITHQTEDNSKRKKRALNQRGDSGFLFLNVPRKIRHPSSKHFETTRNDGIPKKGWRKRIHWEPKVDPHKYPYLINPRRKCADTAESGDALRNITLLILVKSAPGNFKLRDAVRRTYIKGVTKHGVSCKIVFLLGVPNNDEKMQKEIVEESMTHGDILQEDFVDSYYNLTIKLIMGFKWASAFCSNSHFVMSTDDDVMIDVITLVSDLAKIPTKDRSNFALGQRTEGAKPYRESFCKWYTPVEMWPSDVYPVYPQGHGYVVSQDVILRAYQTSTELLIPVPWDDVYFGILLKKLGVTLLDRQPWYRERHTVLSKNGSNDISISQEFDYLRIELSIQDMDKAWTAMYNVGRTGK